MWKSAASIQGVAHQWVLRGQRHTRMARANARMIDLRLQHGIALVDSLGYNAAPYAAIGRIFSWQNKTASVLNRTLAAFGVGVANLANLRHRPHALGAYADLYRLALAIDNSRLL